MDMRVVALDVAEDELALARTDGAEVVVNARLDNAAQRAIDATGGGGRVRGLETWRIPLCCPTKCSCGSGPAAYAALTCTFAAHKGLPPACHPAG
jgi:threonine dehydrogenase-like Zn-dependent dehydrogenase